MIILAIIRVSTQQRSEKSENSSESLWNVVRETRRRKKKGYRQRSLRIDSDENEDNNDQEKYDSQQNKTI